MALHSFIKPITERVLSTADCNWANLILCILNNSYTRLLYSIQLSACEISTGLEYFDRELTYFIESWFVSLSLFKCHLNLKVYIFRKPIFWKVWLVSDSWTYLPVSRTVRNTCHVNHLVCSCCGQSNEQRQGLSQKFNGCLNFFLLQNGFLACRLASRVLMWTGSSLHEMVWMERCHAGLWCICTIRH